MREEKKNLSDRTKQFALEIVRLFSTLPKTIEAQLMGKQMLRSGTPLGAHYHEAIHARSNGEFIAKFDLGLQELRETHYWLCLLVEANIVNIIEIDKISKEINELISILITISKKIKKRSN